MGVRIYFMDFDTQGSGICQSPKDDILTIKGDLAVFENLLGWEVCVTRTSWVDLVNCQGNLTKLVRRNLRRTYKSFKGSRHYFSRFMP